MIFKIILCAFLVLNFINAEASFKNSNPIKVVPKVIYGIDDRFDVFESSDSLMRELSSSTAAQIPNANLTLLGNVYTLKSKILEGTGICKSERFHSQFAAANCSGFLVSPDTLVTAGHCISTASDCAEHFWVFDFANIDGEKSSFTFNQNQVFRCTKIIAREKSTSNMNDYAVLKLDRPVPFKTPLKFRTSGKVADDSVFTVLGYPSGLPLKITVAANMRDNTNPVFFRTNADTYSGNSGSAVVDSRSGLVEGILVRGDKDYKRSDDGTCYSSVYRDQDGGRGEDATRITVVKGLPGL